jgi:hypothetical protein
MMRQVIAVIAGACLLSALTACSVGMALSGKKDPNLGAFNVGSTRGEAELQLGSPVSSVTNPNGTRTDIYEYELGNEPSAGRAIGHGVMDVLTLGLWEVVGTPIEAFTGSKHRITIVYGKDDRIISLNRAVVSPPATEAGERKEGEEEEFPLTSEVNIQLPKKGPEAKATHGSCFAVNENGTLLTVYHVVQDSESILVHLADGTVTEARLQPKFTDGSVSALSGPEDEEGLLQISVPIQPGNSGGPLVNERGEVVGIVTSTAAVETFLSKTGSLPQNVNWAVNVDYARRLFDSPPEESGAVSSVSRKDAVEMVRRALCMVKSGYR